MSILIRSVTAVCFTTSLLACSAAVMAHPAPQSLEIGTAKMDITPTSLTNLNPMGGSFTSVHDPIYARVLLLKSGSSQALIVSTDLIEIGDMQPLQKEIAKKYGIPADHILITASHDHSAPRIGDVTPGSLAHPGGKESKDYTQWVFQKIEQGVESAQHHLQPAEYGIGHGKIDININRDQYFPDKGWQIGENPQGPSNKTVTVLKFTDAKKQPLAVLINYAVHSTVTLGTNQISGDLAGAAEHFVERQYGDKVVALWTLSSVADQAPRISRWDDHSNNPNFAWTAAESQGWLIGDEVVKVANQINTLHNKATIQAKAMTLQCPSQKGTDVMSDMKQAQVDKVGIGLSLLMLNNVAFTGVSGEVMTKIEQHLQEASPYRNTLLMSITNNRVGYLPDDEDYDRPIFEVKGSPAARGCVENGIVDNFVKMMNELQQ